MYGCELDLKGSWALMNWCFWTVVLEKTLESPLDWKKIKPVHPKGNQTWIFIGRTNAEPEVKNWLIRKDPDAGREGDSRGWDGCVASPTRWTWAWASSGSWWWTGKPGVLQSMGSQREGHKWVTELNCTARRYPHEEAMIFSEGGPIWKLTSLGVVSLANMGQVFQFMSSRYCWCTCSPSPYTLALGSWMESCRNWSANSRGPTLESNLDTGRKHGTGGQVVWRECSCLERRTVLCCVQSLCRVHLLVTPRTVIHRAPLSMGFSRQEYWSWLPFPSPGIRVGCLKSITFHFKAGCDHENQVDPPSHFSKEAKEA